MDFIEKIKREIFMRPIIRKGYSRKWPQRGISM